MKKRRGAETKRSRRAKAPLRRSSRRRVSPAGSPPLLLPADWLLSFTLVPLISHCLWGRPGECSCLQWDPDLCRANNLLVTVIVKSSLIYSFIYASVHLCVDPELHALPLHPQCPFFVCPPPLILLPNCQNVIFFFISNSQILLDCVFLLAACVLHVRLCCYRRRLAQ